MASLRGMVLLAACATLVPGTLMAAAPGEAPTMDQVKTLHASTSSSWDSIARAEAAALRRVSTSARPVHKKPLAKEAPAPVSDEAEGKTAPNTRRKSADTETVQPLSKPAPTPAG